MFAFWYLISKPRQIEKLTTPTQYFGYKKTYSGVGVFVYRIGKDYRLQAKQDFDSGQIDIGELAGKFDEGSNGCTLTYGNLQRSISSGIESTGVSINLTVSHSKMAVTYGKT